MFIYIVDSVIYLFLLFFSIFVSIVANHARYLMTRNTNRTPCVGIINPPGSDAVSRHPRCPGGHPEIVVPASIVSKGVRWISRGKLVRQPFPSPRKGHRRSYTRGDLIDALTPVCVCVVPSLSRLSVTSRRIHGSFDSSPSPHSFSIRYWTATAAQLCENARVIRRFYLPPGARTFIYKIYVHIITKKNIVYKKWNFINVLTSISEDFTMKLCWENFLRNRSTHFCTFSEYFVEVKFKKILWTGPGPKTKPNSDQISVRHIWDFRQSTGSPGYRHNCWR